MYLDYFGLSEAPFSITPDPSFVYLSQRHRDALAHLLYGVGQGGSGGFVQLTGEVGTGKTTLCRCLLEQVPEGTYIALILNPLMTPVEMLAAICEELGIDVTGVDGSTKRLADRLNAFLLEAHRGGGRVVLVIDEAQNLSPEALEHIRLLTNLETSKEKLLQIILLGQPELRELLQRRSLRQLAQRITARYHLTPLGREDTARYVQHRLQVAGAERSPFRRSALKALYQRSHGVPRLINIIADRALVGAFAGERQYIDARQVHAAADEVQLGEPGVRQLRWPWAVAAALVLLLAAGTWYQAGPRAVQPEPAVAALPPPAPTDTPAAATVQPPDADWLNRQHLQAWRGMGAAWGRPGDAALIEAACQGNHGLGYACLRDHGNWARIQHLGLPVVLVLPGAITRHLMLLGIDGEGLLVGMPGAGEVVTRASVEPLWLGAYLVAWPQSAGWPRETVRGDSGPAVEAILEMASTSNPPYQGERGFGTEFEAWLKQFQIRNGLDPDGIVGPKTLLYLMRDSIEQPRLATRLGEGN